MPKVEQEAGGKRRRELSGTGYLKFLLFQKGDASDSQDAAVSVSELETARSRALPGEASRGPRGSPRGPQDLPTPGVVHVALSASRRLSFRERLGPSALFPHAVPT